jgi:acetyl-CoA carboxylase biotin carboxylase subunit
MFKKILVANRGEIAVRILRSCREMDIRSATIYSDADKNAMHTRYADEAYYIGPPPAAQSYLQIDRIIETAKKIKAEAIHPGYGFLAENTAFAEACETAGIVFIGPTSKAIRLLGDKIASKKTMSAVNIPVIPGSNNAIKDQAQAEKIAEQIGYPILIKAAGGGGGKGMRVVKHSKTLVSSIKQAVNEAQSAFNNPVIFIEKFLEAPRHIEFQILADNHGNVIHLFERECSVQRRHQKLVEESPSAIMDRELRSTMGQAAINAVKASNYTNAGTVEFMVDQHKNFYFLEMNTRLQVEHPVTELITGIDIVKEQIKIAHGDRLSRQQDDIKMKGAAIECRISAEDPENNFAPSTGKITEIIEPGGPGIRIDSGVREGFEVPIYYDPLIAKLLIWAPTRQEAIVRARRALREYSIRGIKTSIPFHILVMNNGKFIAGEYDTTFIDRTLGKVVYPRTNQKIAAIAAAVRKILQQEQATGAKPGGRQTSSPWKMSGRRNMMRSS